MTDLRLGSLIATVGVPHSAAADDDAKQAHVATLRGVAAQQAPWLVETAKLYLEVAPGEGPLSVSDVAFSASARVPAAAVASEDNGTCGSTCIIAVCLGCAAAAVAVVAAVVLRRRKAAAADRCGRPSPQDLARLEGDLGDIRLDVDQSSCEADDVSIVFGDDVAVVPLREAPLNALLQDMAAPDDDFGDGVVPNVGQLPKPPAVFVIDDDDI